ncbi:MAG: 30S ribosomal protein S7 [Candidatus Diapherotrites archaeon]|nr:30S ribosomal protein S7 [Candidatus Diapherotrites archaeon]
MFEEWDTKDVVVSDPGLISYINLKSAGMHSHGRHTAKQFGKSEISIVERLVNSIMRSCSGKKIGGKMVHHRFGCGKKTAAIKAVRGAFGAIEKKSKKNPIQVLVAAIENSAPREETTRVKFGGITRHIAVDISPQRRVDFALRNISVAALGKAYKSKKSRAEALAEEILAASENDNNCMAIQKKNEMERVAKGAR